MAATSSYTASPSRPIELISSYPPPIFGRQACSSPKPNKYDPVRVSPEDCIERIKKVFEEAKLKMPSENVNLSEFRCTDTNLPLNDPVYGWQCGHLFERARVQYWVATRGGVVCKACGPGHDIYADRFAEAPGLRASIMKWQKECPVVMMSPVEKEEKHLLNLYTNIADFQFQAGNFVDALDSFSKAFLYTNDINRYTVIPTIYKKMKLMDKAALAYLHLALGLYKAGETREALHTLKQCVACSPKPLKIDHLIVGLQLSFNHGAEQLNEAIAIASKTMDIEDAIFIAKQVLTYDPSHLEAYLILCGLIQDHRENSHFVLKGADCATKAGKLALTVLFNSRLRRS